MQIANLRQPSVYSVIGTVSFLPLLVLHAMVGVGHDEPAFRVAIALLIVSIAGFFISICKTPMRRAEVKS